MLLSAQQTECSVSAICKCSGKADARVTRPVSCFAELVWTVSESACVTPGSETELKREREMECELSVSWGECRVPLYLHFRCVYFQVSTYATLFAQALPRDAHSTPYYYARPQTLPLNYQERSAPSAQSSGSLGSSGISSIGAHTLNGPTPPPPSLLPG